MIQKEISKFKVPPHHIKKRRSPERFFFNNSIPLSKTFLLTNFLLYSLFIKIKELRMSQALATEERYTDLKEALQSFQAARIRQTYTDVTAMPQYAKLGEFFFEQIYGPQDFGFRNHSIKNLHHKLSGFLKGEIIEGVGKVIELQDLSDALDEQMAQVMLERQINPELTMPEYAEIYRALDNYDQRVYQIDLLVESVKAIHHISQIRFIGWSLKVVDKAAHLAGMGKIMDFLVEGYDAFHSVKDINFFVQSIEQREKALNDRLFEVD